MHYNIWQVSTKPIDADEFITPTDCESDGWESWADYIDDLSENLDVVYKYFPFLNDNFKMFERDGEVLTYKGDETFLKLWEQDVDEKYAEVKSSFANDMARWRLANCARKPFGINDRIWLSEWSGDCAELVDEFADFCHHKLKVGDKLYLGNVLDFHF